MATTNRFQTRVFISDKGPLTPNEIRLNSLLTRAQTYVQKLDEIEQIERTKNSHRENQLNSCSEKLTEKIICLYKTCFDDLKQSFEQLKFFQQMMINLLNHANENNLDAKKLSVIEHEICILKCLSYQLDTSKVKINGKLKLKKFSNNNLSEISVDDQSTLNQKKINEPKDFICRILLHNDQIENIENSNLIQEFVQTTTNNQIDQTTPERVLTIRGPRHLEVIESILSNLYSPPATTTTTTTTTATANQCEIRVLLHQSYAPLILGKLGDKAKILREKYSLHTLTIHPTCAPLSNERVLLIQSLAIEKILSCLEEIFQIVQQNSCESEEILLYNEMNYDSSLAHEYGGYPSNEIVNRSAEHNHDKDDENQEFDNDDDEDDEDEDGVRRYSAFDAWNGSVDVDVDHEYSVVKLADDSIIKEFWINHGQFGALLGPHGIRIAQIRSQCRTVRIHTVAGSSIDTCSVKVIGPRADVQHAVNLIFQSIKEHDRKFPFKHHRFSGRVR